MSRIRSQSPVVALVLMLVAALAQADELPQLTPTRDVDISYDVSRPDQPKIRERVRWLASEHLERVDGPDKSATIFDRDKDQITVLAPRTRTFSQLEGTARRPPEPAQGTALKRGNDALIAGLHCTEWTWLEDAEAHTVCTTPDGVLLRLASGGQTIMEARSVTYAPQRIELFQVPDDYAPALAPEGGPAD
jgi:hypothetical protein